MYSVNVLHYGDLRTFCNVGQFNKEREGESENMVDQVRDVGGGGEVSGGVD